MAKIYEIIVNKHSLKHFNVKAETSYEAKCYIEQMYNDGHINMAGAEIECDIYNHGTTKIDKDVIDLTINPFESAKNIIKRNCVTIFVTNTIDISYTDANGKHVMKYFEKKDVLGGDIISFAVQVVINDIISERYKSITTDGVNKLMKLLKQNVKVCVA